MSLEPAVATLIGFAVLKEVLDLRDVAAVVLVTAAAAGASLFASQGALDRPGSPNGGTDYTSVP
jgi:inner membrane transporter RhtA